MHSPDWISGAEDPLTGKPHAQLWSQHNLFHPRAHNASDLLILFALFQPRAVYLLQACICVPFKLAFLP